MELLITLGSVCATIFLAWGMLLQRIKHLEENVREIKQDIKESKSILHEIIVEIKGHTKRI